jgi:hypothetical protein
LPAYHKTHIAYQFVYVWPIGKMAEPIITHKHVELRTFEPTMQHGQGIYSRKPLLAQHDAAEFWVIFDCQPHHSSPRLHQKEHFVQPTPDNRLARKSHMPGVYRIKRPAVNPNLFHSAGAPSQHLVL